MILIIIWLLKNNKIWDFLDRYIFWQNLSYHVWRIIGTFLQTHDFIRCCFGGSSIPNDNLHRVEESRDKNGVIWLDNFFGYHGKAWRWRVGMLSLVNFQSLGRHFTMPNFLELEMPKFIRKKLFLIQIFL